MEHELTRVDKFGNWYCKREDIACFFDLNYPSGSKVRQYMDMSKQYPEVPMIVGCSADSCMQIYVAASAKLTGVKGIIYTAKRKLMSEATMYAKSMGAEINEIIPAYLNIIRIRASARSKEIGQTVKWNVQKALDDTVHQCSNIPQCKRVLISTGSGLTAIGVLVGLSKLAIKPKVVAIAVSTMAKKDNIIDKAVKIIGDKNSLPAFELIPPTVKYQKYKIALLPDGTPLDPFYAAKAYPYLQDGDLLWTPGLRPVCSMPLECQRVFSKWDGKNML